MRTLHTYVQNSLAIELYDNFQCQIKINMNCEESQQEEMEVLKSIYDGDDLFKVIDKKTIQYKIGADGTNKSFLLEIGWGSQYPEQLPSVNLDAFYNKHIVQDIKASIVRQAEEQCAELLETAMTYTVIEWCKENADDLLQDQPDHFTPEVTKEDLCLTTAEDDVKKKAKKEQLTKGQKKRMFDRFGAAHVNSDDKPRGWNWMDIVKHLSQTGSQSDNPTPDS